MRLGEDKGERSKTDVLVYCDECRQQWLQSVHSVRRVHNLASGVMAVELDGYCGHRLAVMTGRATDKHPDRRPAPAICARAVATGSRRRAGAGVNVRTEAVTAACLRAFNRIGRILNRDCRRRAVYRPDPPEAATQTGRMARGQRAA
jgi:hypothetical protein